MSLLWHYPRCFVVDVHDGDTITVDIDLGQQFWTKGRPVRLFGIAALELKEPGGLEARDFLRTLLPVGMMVSIDSTGWDKYAGRIDGRVYIGNGKNLILIQDLMISNGYAVPWNGTGKQPKSTWPREA